jgi:hypothetical protein
MGRRRRRHQAPARKMQRYPRPPRLFPYPAGYCLPNGRP